MSKERKTEAKESEKSGTERTDQARYAQRGFWAPKICLAVPTREGAEGRGWEKRKGEKRAA